MFIKNNPRLIHIDLKNFRKDGTTDEGGIIISNNASLISIKLESFEYTNSLQIENNIKLETVDLRNLRGVGDPPFGFSFDIIGNTRLTELNLSSLSSVGTLHIDGTMLSSISLNSLIRTSNRFEISNNSELKQLVAPLFTETRHFTLNNNPKLIDINFESLKYAYSNSVKFSITNNALITNLNTFRKLKEIDGELIITNNPSLTDCSGLCNILNNNGVTGTIIIENNPSECSSQSEVVTACNTPQCPTGKGDVTLRTQTEVDQFVADYPNCTSIKGVLIISGNDITDLSGLSKLTGVGEVFKISDCPELLNIDFNNLEHVGTTDKPDLKITNNLKLKTIAINKLKRSLALIITDNPELTSIHFDKLESVGGSHHSIMRISNNNKLTSVNFDKLDDVSGAGHTKGLEMINNIALEELNFPALHSAQNFQIGKNPKLHSIKVDKLRNDGGNFHFFSIYDNPELVSISACNMVGGSSTYSLLSNNPILNSLCFDSLKEMREIQIRDSNLANLNTFQNLTTVTGNLTISNNPNLTDCSGLCNLLNNNGVSGTITIENNPSECSSQSEVATACNAPQCPTGDVTLTTQAEVDQFVADYPNCEVIEGNLKIDGLTITNLSGLSKITKLETGSLTIQNTSAISIDFKNLIFIGGDLRFNNNVVLEQVNLDNLATIDFGEVHFYQNPKLKEISLNKLASQIIDLYIRENASLTTLSLCTLPSTQGQFYIHKNTVLNTLCFDELITVGGNFEISQSNLTTVTTFQNLKTIELELHIQDNANLTSLDFSSLQTIGMSIYVEKNSTLSQLNLDHLATLGMEMTFSDNPSLTAVSLNNLKSDIQSISFYRNPSLVSLSLCQLPSVDDITLNDNTSLNTLCFDSLLKINGRLDISKSALEDITTFQNVLSAGDIYFNNNSKLKSVNFNHLSSVANDIFFSFNDNLNSLDFCNITLVSGMISLTQNTALSSICFDELKQVSAILNISHSSLSNLDTFQNLTTAGELGIFENSNLTDCSGLCNILSNNGVSGMITINNNPSECSSQTEVESSCSALAIDDELASNFTVYPNPTKRTLNLTGDLTNATYSISDIMGRVLKKEQLKTNTIDISTFKSGVYYLSVFKDESTFVKTVIKQ
ncbi:MAG: T9SS type A sorting domain-containing protein [Flavobacteriaceae bacterium]